MDPRRRESIIRALTIRGIPVTEENIQRTAAGPQLQQQGSNGGAGQLAAQAGRVVAGAGLSELGRRGVRAGIEALAPTTAQTTSSALSAPTVVSASPVAANTALSSGVSTPGMVIPDASMYTNSGATTGSMLGTAVNVGTGILGAYGLYNTIDDSYKRQQRGKDLGMTAGSGAASGAAIGSSIDALTGGATLGAGTALGAIIGGLIGLGSGYFGSEKDAHQLTRDAVRDRMVDLGLYEHTPATKERFSMGGDGGYRLPDGRRAFEIVQGQAEGSPIRDYTEEEGQLVGALNPLGLLLAGGGDTEESKIKAAGNAVGLLYNQLKENVGEPGVSMDEVRGLYGKAGADQGSLFRALDLMRQGGAISEDQHLAANNAINQLYGREYYTEQQAAEDLALADEQARRLLGMGGV